MTTCGHVLMASSTPTCAASARPDRPWTRPRCSWHSWSRSACRPSRFPTAWMPRPACTGAPWPAAACLSLGLLADDEARELLASRIGADRVAAEPAAVSEIIARCARLPLALAVAAARASVRADIPLGRLAGELRDAAGGLDAFATDDAA